MSIDLPSVPTPPALAANFDANGALEARMFGGLDAVRAAKESAAEFTPLDLECARFEYNDFGNGKRLMMRFADRLIYVKDIGWHGWTGKQWSLDHGEQMANQTADETHTAIFTEAKALAEKGPFRGELPADFEDRIATHLKWANASGNVNRRNQMLDSAQTYVTKLVSDLDADNFLFNCENGTLDLNDPEHIKLRRHNPRDVITRISPVRYEPKAPPPVQFLAFLDRVLPDKTVQLFLQQWAGVSLTGDIGVQSLIVQHGKGANGKSTLEEVMRHILGDYAMTVEFATLLNTGQHRAGSAPSPDLARLRGCRAAFASEPDQGVKFSEGLIKQVTGGTKINARFLNKEFFEYMPAFKLWLACNHKPIVQGADTGIWRRLKLVPYGVIIPEAERDPSLPEKLKTEAAGILNWMLDGYRYWRDKGALVVPASVAAATEEYKAESDKIGAFAVAVTEPDAAGRVAASKFFEVYLRWCKANAVFPVGQTLFGRRISELYPKTKQGLLFYTGVRLKPEWESAHGDANEPPPAQAGDPGYEPMEQGI